MRTREQLFQARSTSSAASASRPRASARSRARAGTSRASFYFHYPCKEAVLLDLQWRVEIEIVERMRDARTLRAALGDADRCADRQAETSLAPGDLLRDMLSVYIRRPAGLDLADQPFPLMMEVGTALRRRRAQRELRAGLDPALATNLFLTSLFGLVVSPPAPLAERRDELQQLASLFLDDRRRRRAAA